MTLCFFQVHEDKHFYLYGKSFLNLFFAGRSGYAYSSAVGLSALSLLAPLSLRFAKDAAPIPNAFGR